jgi:FtsH-binding integral membrane protein
MDIFIIALMASMLILSASATRLVRDDSIPFWTCWTIMLLCVLWLIAERL